jgi:transmembrane sensor
MDKHNHALEDLIRKYENGDTSLAEERELLQYFTTQETDLKHAGIQSQFRYFQRQQKESLAIPITLDQVPNRRLMERAPWQLLLRVAAVAVVALGIGWWWLGYNATCTITTGAHEQTTKVLPDGTTVFLNSDTELSYNRQFDDSQRTVRLKGEAYFEVQRDAARPFIIHAGSITAEVLGTSFNLRSYAGEEFDALDVREGRVRFGATEKVVVERGGGAKFYRHQQRLEATSAAINADAWKSRKLSFSNASMKDVIRDLERFYHVTIRVKSPALLQCHFTAEFVDTPIDEVVKVISATFDFRYRKVGDTYFLSGKPCTP